MIDILFRIENLMSSIKLSQMNQLVNKFRGCLVGGLIGDCLGAPFEGEFPISRSVLSNFVVKQLEETNKSFQVFPYTDDSAMTKSVAESLIQMKGFNAIDMSKKFTIEYYKQPKRGYGNHVIDVFAALKFTNFERPFEPARIQFGGNGSYGNGGAMRISPISVFGYHLSDEELIEMASDCARITHSNRNGYNGAILQSLAIHKALHTQVSQNDLTIDIKQFLNSLIEKMEKIESKNNENQTNSSENKEVIETPFTDKLKEMKKIFESESQGSDLSTEKVVHLFGNQISAIRSVPTAIYSVLRAQKPLNDFESDNPFIRTLYFALSLGGDTDTIACMACSIAGALYGTHFIPDILQRHCEDSNLFVKYSDDLYNLAVNQTQQ